MKCVIPISVTILAVGVYYTIQGKFSLDYWYVLLANWFISSLTVTPILIKIYINKKL